MSFGRVLVSLSLLICVVLCAVEEDNTHVIMQVFSSEKNPAWTLTGSKRARLLELLQPYVDMERFACYPQLNKLDLGYQGFTIVDSANQKCMHITNVKEVETFLLDTFVSSRVDDSNYSSTKLNAIIQHASSVISTGLKRYVDEQIVDGASATITPIRGPDNVTAYNPGKWNVWPQQGQNNCYNYGNDVRTDTFAQPGRGTGHRWEYNTCESVWDASIRDGLIPYSKDKAPAWDEVPKVGHFIALCIWPNVNFHWMRKDASGYWSHKPGGTEVRDYDSNGNKIKDPKDANRGPYTTFCGYLISIPSNMTIN